MNLTPESEALFASIVRDLPNWSGCVPCYNHITKYTRGNLTQLKKAGLVRAFVEMDEAWIELTPAGEARAAKLTCP